MSTSALNSLSSSNMHDIYSSYPTGRAQHSSRASENPALPCSCPTNQPARAEPADKGELWLRVLLAGESPGEEAIMYFMTVTIPLWKPIHFLLGRAAPEQSQGAGR